jgi:hypothetical protein
LQKPFRGDTAVSKEMRGIAITLAAMLLFALMDAVSKYLSTRYPFTSPPIDGVARGMSLAI